MLEDGPYSILIVIFAYMIISTILHIRMNRRMRRFVIKLKSVPGYGRKRAVRPVGLDGDAERRKFYHSDKPFADGIRAIIKDNQDRNAKNDD